MKRAFKVKWKPFFIIFKGLSFAVNCLRPECASEFSEFGSFRIQIIHTQLSFFYLCSW